MQWPDFTSAYLLWQQGDVAAYASLRDDGQLVHADTCSKQDFSWKHLALGLGENPSRSPHVPNWHSWLFGKTDSQRVDGCVVGNQNEVASNAPVMRMRGF